MDGFHCVETMEVMIENYWTLTRIEMAWA
ncbi:DUF5348 domain-containing protein [Acetoanaerobium sticklandii]